MIKEENYISEVKVGKKVENFGGNAFLPNKEFGNIELSDYMKEDKWVILFFWPLDFTFVCPTEIRALSEQYDKFVKEGAQVIGISTDSVHSHKAWCEQPTELGGLGYVKFPMLEDTNHAISKQFGVLVEEAGIALRGTFIISPQGILESALINNTAVGRNTDEILRTLAAFKTGGLCPMNWNAGESTL